MSTRKKAAIAVASVFIILFIAAGAHLASTIHARKQLLMERRSVCRLIHNALTIAKSADHDHVGWNKNIVIVVNCIGNSLPGSSFGELQAYHHELNARFANNRPPTVEDIEWLWARLPRSNAHAAKCAANLEPLFLDTVERASQLKQELRQASDPRPRTAPP